MHLGIHIDDDDDGDGDGEVLLLLLLLFPKHGPAWPWYFPQNDLSISTGPES